MKIGIITIMDSTNYGNRLQNYASCHFLRKEMHCNVQTVRAISEKPFNNHRYDVWAKNQVVRLLSRVPGFVEKRFGAQTARWARFANWSRRIPTKNYYQTSILSEELNQEYDLFLVGSDQVWNCQFPAFKEADYLLKFADNRKKASLAASFGFEKVPEKYRETFCRELAKFNYISVRENSGQIILKELTGRDVPCLIDPVMMLDEEQWMKTAAKPHSVPEGKYILNYCLGNEQNDHTLQRWADHNGYQILELMNPNNKELYSCGPGEFLWLIKNAELVCSDSFHCIVLSILFKKPFIVYSRMGKENYMSSRLETLLDKFGLESRWSSQLSPEQYLCCDFSKTSEVLERERRQFRDYIQKILDNAPGMVDVPKLAPKDLCTGCSACEQICQRDCIQLRGDQNDFRYPEIVNPQKCVHCELCTKTCPVLNRTESVIHEPDVYAAMSLNERIRKDSSSGGVFTEIAEWVIAQGGIVFGAAYNDSFEVVHRAVETVEGLRELRGAKYSESRLGNSFRNIKNELEEDRIVLFAGTPCQNAGLKAYLHKDYKNLICLDFVCHGIPSPMVWREYIHYRAEQDNNAVIPVSINLRSKETGWSRYTYSNQFVYADHEKMIQSGESRFMQLFVGDSVNRISCGNCSFKGFSRCTDFTLGDFWGIWDIKPEMDDNKGTSVVLVHSQKGRVIFSEIEEKLRCTEVSLEEASRQNPSMIRSSKTRANRQTVLEKIRNREVQSLFSDHT